MSVVVSKITSLCTLFFSSFNHAALVSFGKVTSEQKETLEKYGVALYSWNEFLQLVGCSI